MKSSINSFKYHLICIIIVLMYSSCKKDRASESGLGNLQVSLLGIEDYQEISNNNKLASNQKTNDISSNIITSYNEFDAITSINILEPTNKISLNKSTSIKSTKKAASTQIGSNIKYRLLFFNETGSSLISQYEITGTGAPQIHLNIGTKYKWVAYSMNETTTVPLFSNNIIAKIDIANKDFLYATGNITIQQGNNFLELELKRYTTQFEVNVDLRGMFASVHNSDNNHTLISLTNGNTNFLETADFNIITGEFDENTYSQVVSPALRLTPSAPGQYYLTKAAFHSVARSVNIPANQLKLNFAPLSLIMDNGSNRKFTTATVNFNSHLTLSNISPRGRKYKLDAILVESPITVGSTKWARSNLWYSKDSTASGLYRFRVSPHYRDTDDREDLNTLSTSIYTKMIADRNDFWKFNARIPTGASETGYDPCNDVYPIGLWKMPAKSDYDYLVSTNANQLYLINRQDYRSGVNLLGLIDLGTANRYEMISGWNNSAVKDNNSPYSQGFDNRDSETSNMHNLYFQGIGYKDNNITEGVYRIYQRPTYLSTVGITLIPGASDALVELGLVQGLSGGGYYWFGATQTSLTPNLFTFNANNGSLATVGALGTVNLNILNIGTGTLNRSTSNILSREYSANIRCVRAIP